MPTTFNFDGEEVEDNVLFYWSTVSISRALRFYAEAKNQQANTYVLATIALYYCTFHLGVFLSYSAPHFLNQDMRRQVNKWLKDGSQDPRRALSHTAVGEFLKVCQSHGLPETVFDAFKRAQALREFVNYGPDLRHNPDTKEFRIFNRAHQPSEYLEVLKLAEAAFHHAVDWACRNGMNNGILIPIALDYATPFFTSNDDGEPYFSQWSSLDVLEIGESLRSVLYEKCAQTRHP